MSIALSTVDAILQAEDIESLIEHGAPQDEYSHEAAMMYTTLGAAAAADMSEDQVYALVENVWASQFNLSREDLEKRTSAFRRVAREILNAR